MLLPFNNAAPKGTLIQSLLLTIHFSNLAGLTSRNASDAGGVLLRWNEADSSSFTHVVASHRGEPIALIAAKQGKEVVSLLWLWECLVSQRLLPVGEEQV